MRILFQFLKNFAVFNLLVFITVVSLTRCIYECCIHIGASVRNDTLYLQHLIELREKLINDFQCNQYIPEQPDRLDIRYFFSQRQAEKTLKTDSICDLILCLII